MFNLTSSQSCQCFKEISKDTFSKYKKVRKLYNPLMGEHYLYNKDGVKYLVKQLHEDNKFITTHPLSSIVFHKYTSPLTKVSSYIYPIVGIKLQSVIRSGINSKDHLNCNIKPNSMGNNSMKPLLQTQQLKQFNNLLSRHNNSLQKLFLHILKYLLKIVVMSKTTEERSQFSRELVDNRRGLATNNDNKNTKNNKNTNSNNNLQCNLNNNNNNNNSNNPSSHDNRLVINLQCLRVHNGQLLYFYDTWMNNQTQIVLKDIKQMQSLFLQEQQLNCIGMLYEAKAKVQKQGEREMERERERERQREREREDNMKRDNKDNNSVKYKRCKSREKLDNEWQDQTITFAQYKQSNMNHNSHRKIDQIPHKTNNQASSLTITDPSPQHSQSNNKQSLFSLIYKPFLLVLCLGSIQLNSRLYQWGQFKPNYENLAKRIHHFKLRYNSSKDKLGDLLEKILMAKKNHTVDQIKMGDVWSLILDKQKEKQAQREGETSNINRSKQSLTSSKSTTPSQAIKQQQKMRNSLSIKAPTRVRLQKKNKQTQNLIRNKIQDKSPSSKQSQYIKLIRLPSSETLISSHQFQQNYQQSNDKQNQEQQDYYDVYGCSGQANRNRNINNYNCEIKIIDQQVLLTNEQRRSNRKRTLESMILRQSNSLQYIENSIADNYGCEESNSMNNCKSQGLQKLLSDQNSKISRESIKIKRKKQDQYENTRKQKQNPFLNNNKNKYSLIDSSTKSAKLNVNASTININTNSRSLFLVTKIKQHLLNFDKAHNFHQLSNQNTSKNQNTNPNQNKNQPSKVNFADDFPNANSGNTRLIKFFNLEQHLPRNQYQSNFIEYLKDSHIKNTFITKIYQDNSLYFGEAQNKYQKVNLCSNPISRQGHGLYIFPSNDIYYGQWKNNQMHGQGVYIFTTSEIYLGQLENGKKQGYGQFIYQDGSKYQGFWKNDKKVGLATVWFGTNQNKICHSKLQEVATSAIKIIKFLGNFKQSNLNDNEVEGIFTCYDSSQNKVWSQQGFFSQYNRQNGKLESSNSSEVYLKLEAKFKKKLIKCSLSKYDEMVSLSNEINRTTYFGQIQPESRGKSGFGVESNNQILFQGNFSENQRNGHGKLINKNQNFVIEGEWKNGIMIKYLNRK